jgi:hypothetical protein
MATPARSVKRKNVGGEHRRPKVARGTTVADIVVAARENLRSAKPTDLNYSEGHYSWRVHTEKLINWIGISVEALWKSV